MKITRHCVLICIGILSTLSLAFAGPLEFYFKKYQEEQIPLASVQSVKSDYFKQLINHKKQKLGTFKQRYYIDETYGPADNAPVFFYICGEAECTQRALGGAIRRHAQKYRAKMVALEHRYYGESMPVKTFSTNDMRFLTTQAALQDLSYFQRKITAEKGWTGKWVAFGGSYPGSLSAYYRLKYPELVVGALASSAPVMAKEDFFEYDTHVTEVAGPECAANIRSVVYEIESALSNDRKLDEIKELFAASKVNNPIDFLYIIADTAASAVQYGEKDIFCKALTSGISPLEGYAEYTRDLLKRMHVSAVDLTPQGAKSEKPEDYDKGVGMRQWFYQSCTEYGYWQTANPNPFSSTRSLLIDLDYHRNICKRLFDMTNPVNTEVINNAYYYPLRTGGASHIYFTNGSQDPWSNLSLTEKNGNTENKKLTYYLIEGSAHCDDLRERTAFDSKALKYSRTLMQLMLQDWLVGCG